MIRYPATSKLHRKTRSGLTAVVLCNWSMYSFSNHTQRTWSVTLLAPDAWLSKTIIRNALDTLRRQTKGSVGWIKLGVGFTWKMVDDINNNNNNNNNNNSSIMLWLLVYYIEFLAFPYRLYAQTMIVWGEVFYFIYQVLNRTIRSAAPPYQCGALAYIYICMIPGMKYFFISHSWSVLLEYVFYNNIQRRKPPVQYHLFIQRRKTRKSSLKVYLKINKYYSSLEYRVQV